jgi:hypothetical protein
MKRAIYGTIALFVGVLIVVWVVSLQHPVNTVKYEDGRVVAAGR